MPSPGLRARATGGGDRAAAMTSDLTRAADAVSRLLAELGPATSPEVVALVVQQACEDLRGSPVGALPELVERLARARLTVAAGDA